MVDAERVFARLRNGDRRLLARLITLVENEDPIGLDLLDALYSRSGAAHIIGISGSPGVGKSSLIAALLPYFVESGRHVAVIAIDPTSPLSGGAVLGDRIRMMERHADRGVFIRSMASRGRKGGLAWATANLIHVLDIAGFATIFVETAGVGQDGTDIADLADTVVVVEAPGLGDGVQAIKSGLLEVGDIVVLNKADQPGASDAIRLLRATLGPGESGPAATPVIGASSTAGNGVRELLQALDNHAAWLASSGNREIRRGLRARTEIVAGIRASIDRKLCAELPETNELALLVEHVANRQFPPRQAVLRVTSRLTQAPA